MKQKIKDIDVIFFAIEFVVVASIFIVGIPSLILSSGFPPLLKLLIMLCYLAVAFFVLMLYWWYRNIILDHIKKFISVLYSNKRGNDMVSKQKEKKAKSRKKTKLLNEIIYWIGMLLPPFLIGDMVAEQYLYGLLSRFQIASLLFIGMFTLFFAVNMTITKRW
jgi:hypothetical protein